jgi:hypothetical protein
VPFHGTRLYVLSPGTGLCCPRHRADRSAQLDLSVGRPGPHDFAVRKSFGRLAQRLRPKLSRPSHPAPNVRDDREAPLLIERGTARTILLICGRRQGTFCKSECTGCDRLARRAVWAWHACAFCPSCSAHQPCAAPRARGRRWLRIASTTRAAHEDRQPSADRPLAAVRSCPRLMICPIASTIRTTTIFLRKYDEDASANLSHTDLQAL